MVATPTFIPAGGPGVRRLEHVVIVLVHEQPVVVLLQPGAPAAVMTGFNTAKPAAMSTFLMAARSSTFWVLIMHSKRGNDRLTDITCMRVL